MFESLESRQFFSVTVGTEPAVDAAPAPVISVDAVEAKKPKPKPTGTTQQTYLVVTMEDCLISSV